MNDNFESPNTLPSELLNTIAKSAERSIYEPHQRIDGDGRQITEMVQISGPIVPGAVKFVAHGQAHLRTKHPDPAGGPAIERTQAIPVNVVLSEATDINHAFDLYDAAINTAAQADVDRLRTDHVRASLANTGGILIPKRRG